MRGKLSKIIYWKDIGIFQYPWESDESGMEMGLNQSKLGSEAEEIAMIL